MKTIIACILCCLGAHMFSGEGSSSGGPRVRTILDADWRFIKQDVAPDADSSGWQTVSIPHTWNAEDGMKRGYYRGPGWYAREFSLPEAGEGRRVFVRFQGVSTVADVYLNGEHLGQHRGAFGAFCFEITPWVRRGGAKNVLRVRADNSRFDDIAPWSGDFLVSGGIYREVEIIETSTVCLSPLDLGSPGVYLRQIEATRERAVLEVSALVSNGGPSGADAEVRVVLMDAAGNKLAGRSEISVVPAGETIINKQTVTLANPHLWDGVRDPYLHTARIEIRQNGLVVDAVEQPVGFRTITHDYEKGIILNGRPYPVRGVNRHQDREGKGWAISKEDKDEDMRLIKDMGATAVRLAHYPHDTYFYDLCDREGLLVWAELALVNHVKDTDAFKQNVLTQFREMVGQHGNHPSIAMWSLYNELVPAVAKAGEPLIQELHRIAKAEDPNRFTVAAPYRLTPEGPLRSTTDLLAFNAYPGWYDYPGERTLAEWFEDWLRSGGRRGIGLSEYGAGASILHHEELPCPRPYHLSPWHPEEYQSQIIEADYKQINETPGVWGSFVWNMFDFACPSRDEGDRPGNLDKGIVTYDRRVAKDAYYFYKANWNPEPMVYITSRRFTERRVAATTVKVYSNCDEVELFINGRSQGVKRPGAYKIAQWEGVPLDEGRNAVSARARRGGREITDACAWTRLPPRAPSGIVATAAAPAAENAIDGKFHTAWTASCKEARPQLTLELPEARELQSASVLWWYGYNRTIEYVLEGSLDGVKFEELARGREERPGRPCLYTFPARTLRFLRMKAWAKHTDATVGIIEFQPGPGEWPAVWPEKRPTRLAQNLDAGKAQTLVLYGTSLTASKGGWAAQLAEVLKARYGSRASVINAAKGGMNSAWGLENLAERVLSRKPDAVAIEFSMNDSAARSKLSVAAARANLEAMIDRILAANPDTEIFLMTMNPVGGAVRERAPKHPHYRGRLDEYYQSVREVAAARGLRLIDHHANWVRYERGHPDDFARHVPDGVHPDAESAGEIILPAMLDGLSLGGS
ncbi:GDSL-type esterase/lipase family protein [Termitidicoccus mucosus]